MVGFRERERGLLLGLLTGFDGGAVPTSANEKEDGVVGEVGAAFEAPFAGAFCGEAGSLALLSFNGDGRCEYTWLTMSCSPSSLNPISESLVVFS